MLGRVDDPEREEPLGSMDGLTNPGEPEVPFNMADITLKEVQEIVKKARSKSAAGPSGVNYIVYKKCPLLLKRLWKL